MQSWSTVNLSAPLPCPRAGQRRTGRICHVVVYNAGRKRTATRPSRSPLSDAEQQQKDAAAWAEEFFESYHQKQRPAPPPPTPDLINDLNGNLAKGNFKDGIYQPKEVGHIRFGDIVKGPPPKDVIMLRPANGEASTSAKQGDERSSKAATSRSDAAVSDMDSTQLDSNSQQAQSRNAADTPQECKLRRTDTLGYIPVQRSDMDEADTGNMQTTRPHDAEQASAGRLVDAQARLKDRVRCSRTATTSQPDSDRRTDRWVDRQTGRRDERVDKGAEARQRQSRREIEEEEEMEARQRRMRRGVEQEDEEGAEERQEDYSAFQRDNRRRDRPEKQKEAQQHVKSGAGSFFANSSFQELGLHPRLVAALGSVNILRPAHIQALTLQAYQGAKSQYLLLADAAGSGKTLAYILPVMQQLVVEEESAGKRKTMPNRPRAVFLTPTEELARQLQSVCRSLTATVKLRVVTMTGGGKWNTQRRLLEEGVDILIATPGRLTHLLGSKSVLLDQCRTIVMDEVDVLLGKAADFIDYVGAVLRQAPDDVRVLMVTATLPEHIHLDLQTQFPGMHMALGPRLHRHNPGLEAELIDCSGGDEISEEAGFTRKAAALYAVMQEKKSQRTIVFCNKITTCRSVENFLKRQHRSSDHFMVLPYHSAIEENKRAGNLKSFLQPPRDKDDERVLVCTDRASRGVDSTSVQHVVLFDWPRDPSEYVRRVGRTARGADGSGAVSILVLGRQVPVAKDILSRLHKGQPIHKLPEA